MDKSLLYIICYASVWLITTIIYIVKSKSYGIGGAILTFYSVSSLSSIYFYINSGAFNLVNFSYKPFIYLFVCMFICISPILFYSKKISKIKIIIPDYNGYIYLFIIICSPFIVEAFAEMLLIAFRTQNNQLGAIYNSEVDLMRVNLTYIGRKTTAIVRWFQFLWPILFFYCLSSKRHLKKLSIFCLLASVTGMIEGYSGASRVAIIRTIIYFIVIYFLFKNSLQEKAIKKINLYLFVFFVIFITLTTLITISRFNSTNLNVDIFTWITLYTGQGELKFAQHVWDLKATSSGDTNFSLIKQVMGFDAITDIDIRRNYYEAKLGIPTNIFYTLIGDWYIDLGFGGTLFLSVVTCIIQFRYLKRITNKKSVTLGSVLFLSLIILILLFGIMYYVFKDYFVQVLLVPTIIYVLGYRFWGYEKK